MAFPSVIQIKEGATTAVNTTSHVITMPDSIQVDDMIVVFFAVDGNPLVTQSGGWTRFIGDANGSAVKGQVWYKRATSTSESLTLTTDTSEQSTHHTYQLRDSTPPIGALSNGNSTNSAPPVLDTGTSRDYLWIVSRHGDSTVVASGAPTGYANLESQAAAGTGGASISTARKTATASSDTPATFTSSTENWVCFTLAFAQQGQFELAVGTDPTGSNDNSYGSLAWTNPTNISATDETYATRTASGTTDSNYLKALAYGLSVDSSATILGIEISIKGFRNGGTTGAIRDDTVRLVKGGSVVGDNKGLTGTNWGTTDGTTRYGGASDLWGTTWTPAEVNASDFGAVLAVQGSTAGTDRVANVDTIRVLVYYSEPPAETVDVNDAVSISEDVTTVVEITYEVNLSTVVKGYGVRISD